MPRFKLFPRYRRASVGELLGTTQAKRRISRKYHLRTFRDPAAPLKNMQRRALRRAGYYTPAMQLFRFLFGGRR